MGACGGDAGCSGSVRFETGAEEESIPDRGDPALPGVEKPDATFERELRKSLAAKGDGYEPHAAHQKADGSPKYVNRLILESSPYLLQHAHNPVNWFAWGPEALARAKEEGKPIFLSVGYSTCHWCHVMARESFEDEEIARYINQHFIPIKVDREVRPDIDDLYMRAVRMLSGQGGWPMTVVLTPDQRPFFGGTYLPARDGDRGAQKGLLSVLTDLASEYEKDREGVVQRARATSEKIKKAVEPSPPGDLPPEALVGRAANRMVKRLDPEHGGFGLAPKFPRPAALDLLLRHSRGDDTETSRNEARDAVMLTLDAMQAGGIFDHIGGGFHRYATDRKWEIPHFEKMLYDNAQLAELYLDAFVATGDRTYERTARQTLDYVLRELTADQGGFFSASDAESETPAGKREEGYYFTWTKRELSEVLDEGEAEVVSAYFGVDDEGELAGRSVLHVERPLEEIAGALSLAPTDFEQLLSRAKQKLLRARAKRKAPSIDDKILVSQNGLMIAALARGARVLGDERYLNAAEKAATEVVERGIDDKGRLLRVAGSGSKGQPAFLEDHAFLVRGLLELFVVSADMKYLKAAGKLQKRLDENFWDEEHGGYFHTAVDDPQLLVRTKPVYDGAEPSGNSVAAHNLLFLANLIDAPRYTKQAEELLRAFSTDLEEGTESPLLLSALSRYYDVPLQVILVHPGKEPPAAGSAGYEMEALVRHMYLPGAVVLILEDDQAKSLAKDIAILDGKRASSKTTAYVCQRGGCELPARDAPTLKQQLEEHAP